MTDKQLTITRDEGGPPSVITGLGQFGGILIHKEGLVQGWDSLERRYLGRKRGRR